MLTYFTKWHDIPGWEGKYQINRLGQVKSLPRYIKYKNGDVHLKEEQILKGAKQSNGYVTFRLGGRAKGNKTEYRHRLLALTFISNLENKREINHKNGIKGDDRLENIEWATSSENRKHSFATGLHPPRKGNGHPRVKYTDDQVLKLRKLKDEGLSNKEISLETGIPTNYLWYLLTKRQIAQ